MPTILGFGDSVTLGVRAGILPGQEFLALLAVRCGATAVNKGVAGNTSSDGLARLQTDVLDLAPNCVTVMFGENDSFVDPTTLAGPVNLVATYDANMRSILTQIRTAGIPIVLYTPWMVRSSPTLAVIGPYIQALRKIAWDFALPLFDAYAVCTQGYLWYAPDVFNALWVDYQHPSPSGHQLIAELTYLPSF